MLQQVIIVPGLLTGVVLTATTPAVPAGCTPWTVQPGDTILRIAMQHHVALQDLLALNRLPQGAAFHTGAVLLLPGPTCLPG